MVASNKIGTTIQNVVLQALVSNLLCEQIITRASYFNVTALLTLASKVGIGAVCQKVPVFATYILTAKAVTSPFAATSDPTMAPTQQPTPATLKINTTANRLYGILAIIFIIALLRLVPSLIDCCTTQKAVTRGHLYDILVVLSDKEEAVLQNVRHEDIVYFREMTSSPDKFLSGWLMNNSAEPLVKRQEAQFWDLYDLLGQSGIDVEKSSQASWKGASGSMKADGDKVVTKQKYLHEASLQIGMIIRVIPSPAYASKMRVEMGMRGEGDDIARCRSRSFNSVAEQLDRVPNRALRLKTQTPRGQNGQVLDQLPACFSSQDDGRVLQDYPEDAANSNKSHQGSFSTDRRGSRARMGSIIEGSYNLPEYHSEELNPDLTRVPKSFALTSEENSDMDDSTHCASTSIELMPETLSDTEIEVMKSKEKRLSMKKRSNMSWTSDGGYYSAPAPVPYPYLATNSVAHNALALPHSFNTSNADLDSNLLSERFTTTNGKHYNSGRRGSFTSQLAKAEAAMKSLNKDDNEKPRSRGQPSSRERRRMEEEKEQDDYSDHGPREEEKSGMGYVQKQEEKEA